MQKSRPSIVIDGRLSPDFTCFFGSSFVSLKFLPGLPFRKQADTTVSWRYQMSSKQDKFFRLGKNLRISPLQYFRNTSFSSAAAQPTRLAS
jgi:hypothetical protein